MRTSGYILEFHPLVEKDYSDAYHWYEMQQKGLGSRFMLHIREKLSLIQNAPDTYSVKSGKGYREAKIDAFPY